MVNTFLRFAQGFDLNSAGYSDFTNGWEGVTTEVPSGTNGITAAEGTGFSIFEQTNGTGPFTRFDGYRSLDSNQGFTTTIKIYLDPGALALGEGFDYSVAANNQVGAHLRDFIFHVTMDTSSGGLLVGASNNTNFDPREDLETINHAQITNADWYTFEHTFFDFGDGTLAVSMTVKNSSGVTLFTEVLNDPSDSFAADFGGNRYGWFTNIDVAAGIAVDDARLLTADANPVQVFVGSTIVDTFATLQDARDAADSGAITGSTFRIDIGGVTQFYYVANGMSIQAAIDAAAAGDTVEVADGAYNESLTITKAVNLLGQDVGADGVPDVALTPTGGNVISLSGDIDNGGAATVSIVGFAISGAGTAGINISSSTDLSSLVIADSAFSNNAVFGIGAGSGAFSLDSISITHSTFTDNGQGGANGAGDIVLFGFIGDATLQDVSIVSSATSGTPDPSRGDNAIQITGRDPVTYDVLGPIGSVLLNNVAISGWYHKPQLLIQGYTDFNGLTLSDVDLSGGTSWGDLLFIDPISTSGTGTPSTPGQPGHFPLTGGNSTLDLSGVTVNSGSTGVLGVDSRIRGTDADDLIIGTNGNDLLNDFAETGIDYGGNDTIKGGAGADILIGGVGVDAVSYQGSPAAVSVDLTTDMVSGGDATGDTIVGFEDVYGSSHNDTLTGSDGVGNDLRGSLGDDLLTGLTGNDTLDGGAGADTLIGGGNPDILVGGAGADVLDGGSSVDKADYTKAPVGVNVNLGTGGISGDAAGDTYSSIEILSGSNFGDTLTGSNGNDDIRGRGGSDIISGGGGNDQLLGYSGNDTLVGGGGDDTLTGGGHNDRFVFSGNFGHDVIHDMNAGAAVRDVIQLVGFGPNYDSFADILAASTQVGAHTVIAINGNTITLIGVDRDNLDPNDFIFG